MGGLRVMSGREISGLVISGYPLVPDRLNVPDSGGKEHVPTGRDV